MVYLQYGVQRSVIRNEHPPFDDLIDTMPFHLSPVHPDVIDPRRASSSVCEKGRVRAKCAPATRSRVRISILEPAQALERLNRWALRLFIEIPHQDAHQVLFAAAHPTRRQCGGRLTRRWSHVRPMGIEDSNPLARRPVEQQHPGCCARQIRVPADAPGLLGRRRQPTRFRVKQIEAVRSPKHRTSFPSAIRIPALTRMGHVRQSGFEIGKLMGKDFLQPDHVVEPHGIGNFRLAVLPNQGVVRVVVAHIERQHAEVLHWHLAPHTSHKPNQAAERCPVLGMAETKIHEHARKIPQAPRNLAPVGRARTYRRGESLDLDITGFAFGGKGIAKIETEGGLFTVFVQNAYPGQRVRARVTECKARYAECSLDEVLVQAPDELDLPHQSIPGAPYARVPMERQHALKEATTLDLYRKIGDVHDVDQLYRGFVPSPNQWHYRNKMEYSFSSIVHDLDTGEKVDRFGLGFKHRGTWWAVEDLDRDSGLFDRDVEGDLHRIRAHCEASGLPAWHPPKRAGFFRFLVVRKSFAHNTLLVNLVTSSAGLDRWDMDGFVSLLHGLWPGRVAGVLHTVNDDTGERVEARAGASRLVDGEERIREVLHGLAFDISMSSFFQTNPQCAERLYAEVVDAVVQDAERLPGEVIMDLFCGTGTIAQLLAQATGKHIIGVDLVESAIEDARISAARNGNNRIDFYAADVGKFLLEFPEYVGRIQVVVLDPPRAGISPKTLRKIIRLDAPRIVYVSCNPATQARDLKTLAEWGYALQSFKLVDQFPHTAHVESVAIFEKQPAS